MCSSSEIQFSLVTDQKSVKLQLGSSVCWALHQAPQQLQLRPVAFLHTLVLWWSLQDHRQVGKVRAVEDSSKTLLAYHSMPNVGMSVPVTACRSQTIIDMDSNKPLQPLHVSLFLFVSRPHQNRRYGRHQEEDAGHEAGEGQRHGQGRHTGAAEQGGQHPRREGRGGPAQCSEEDAAD